jgi:hypothetical protein
LRHTAGEVPPAVCLPVEEQAGRGLGLIVGRVADSGVREIGDPRPSATNTWCGWVPGRRALVAGPGVEPVPR